MEIKVRITIDITTITRLGIEIGVGIAMVIRKESITTRIGVDFTFHLGIVIQILAIREYRTCLHRL